MRIMTALLLCLLPAIAAADEHASQDYVALYGGYYDISKDNGDNAAQFGLEYRFADVWRGVRPSVGANVTTDGSVYGYGGMYWDVPLSDSVVFSPNFMAGAWGEGDGKDLGHTIEFRSGLELNYQFDGGRRLGVAYNHISNAGIGSKNPGSEALLLVYQLPLGE